MQETRVRSLGQENPLEKEMKFTPVFLPREFHGQRSLSQGTVHGVTKSWTQLSIYNFIRDTKGYKLELLKGKTCLLRNLYAGQEAIVRTGHGTTDWFQIGKGVRQGCILSPFLFNFYAEYIMRNAGLEEAQAGIKIGGRNINNLRYADDTTLMAENGELKSLLMKVQEKTEKVDLKLNIQKTKIMASGPVTSWQIGGKQWK